jgi:hypothetical protein
MRRPLTICLIVPLMWLLTACRSAAVASLPSTTPMPTLVIPTFTATFLPPPTVTPYPTATPRGVEAIVPLVVATAAPDGLATLPAPPPAAPVIVDTPIPPTATPSPPPTPTLTPTVTIVDLPAGASLGGMIYFSDFSAGWPSFDDPTAKIALKGGQYQFEIGPFDGRFFNTTLIKQRNLYAQVEVTPNDCSNKAGYGMMFRFKDASNYYLLTLFCDGTYAAVSRVAGAVAGMADGKLPAGLDPGTKAVHVVGVLTREDTYTLFLDKQVISTFTDTQLREGDVAIYGVSQGAQVLRASFDNLKVWNVY